MNIILYLAAKYLKFKASDRGISRIATIAFLTVMFSSTASVVILAGANGFHSNFKDKLMSRDAHITILGSDDGISNYQYYIDQISLVDGVEEVFPYFDIQGIMNGAVGEWGTFVKAIPADYPNKDDGFSKNFHLEEGTFDMSQPHSIILGNNLARNVGAAVGSYVFLVMYDNLMPVKYKFKVTGIFTAGYAEYDSSLAFISFEEAQAIMGMPDNAYGLAVKVADPYEVDKYLPAISDVCPYTKYTWKNLNRNNLVALDNEKLLMQIIIFFFFAVVFFNILSTMIAMVLDKKEEIGILKAMGLKPGDAMHVFLFDGFFIGVLGGVLGILLGLIITISLNDILHAIEYAVDFVNISAHFVTSIFTPVPYPAHFEFFNSSVYYISGFPIKIEFGDLVFTALLGVTISTLAVVFPAWKAGKMRPVEVLRND
ncbi:MAG: hypothetical protein A2Y33_07345 [Spirochaetes bacterium GWF1_51_8]|nr:MAG: hypothetical protein A2Y33_07345 [Spirochaetes bacterium GWF1_51_8]